MDQGQLILSVRDALVSFGEKPIFKDLTFNIHQGSRISLVGKNGAGKTTLMNIITGGRDLDDGERWLLEGIKIGYLQQDVSFLPKQTVLDFVFETAEDQLEPWEKDTQIEKIIKPLGLDPAVQMGTLSGGQVRRAALARSLIEDPDILLLDEPTNHLDLGVIEWLETYLRNYRGALVCVSHDRRFLETISNSIFWLDRGRLKVCAKGFSHFDDWSSGLLEQEARELANRQKLVAQEVEWASRGVKARRKRNMRRVEMMQKARDALKRDLSSFRRAMGKINIDMPDIDVSSKIVAEFYNVSKSFSLSEADVSDLRTGEKSGTEKTILKNFHLRIQRGDRIGILGKNGSGKTTFLKLLIGDLKPDGGSVKRRKELEFSYFDQKREDLKNEETLWKTLCPDGGDHVDVMGKPRHVCGYLKDFLFDPSRVNDKVVTLSGGQKNRLMLAKILANPKTCLILDEPTNDLDMDTLDMLEDILSRYTGTLIVVSHDRDFLDQTVTRILAFEGEGRIDSVVGGYSDYLEAIAKREQKVDKPASKPSGKITKTRADSAERNQETEQTENLVEPVSIPRKKLTFKLQHELDGLPAHMAELEAEVDSLSLALHDPAFYTRDPEGFMATSRKHEEAKKALDAAELRWLELDEMTNTAYEKKD